MEGTLLPRDIVLVKRVINTDREIVKGKRRSKNLRGEIVVFNRNTDACLIKRCVGIPGDTIEIIDGNVNCNEKEIGLPLLSRAEYRLWGKVHRELINLELINYDLLENAHMNDGLFYTDITLSSKDIDKVVNLGCIDSIKPIHKVNPNQLRTFPNSKEFEWTHLNFGPLLIPKTGLTIQLNIENRILYGSLIHNELLNALHIDSTFANTLIKKLENYTFRKDYYFMIGDNRNNSRDSREWGFIQSSEIVGKVIANLFPKNYNNKKRKTHFFIKRK